MMCQTSLGMSSRRSRSGGSRIGKHAQAVVEVLAERAFADHAPQVAMRGRDDADVHFLRLRGAEPLERAFLQHAQELGLQVEREIADLVEKQRAAVGQLEATLPRRRRRR